VRAISSTGIDLLAIGDLPNDPHLIAYLESFDRIVSWYGANRPEFRATIRAEFHRALPPPEYIGHAIDFFSGQVGAPAGKLPRIKVGMSERRNSVVIHPFSGSGRKNWPLDSFRRVAADLGSRAEWCAGPDEEVPGAVRYDNLLLLAKWLCGAGYYLGNDSGITHLAAAAGVPGVAIFVATDPAVWAPRGPNVTVLCNPDIDDVSRLLGSRTLAASSEQSAVGLP
jgi:hypothetical protein